MSIKSNLGAISVLIVTTSFSNIAAASTIYDYVGNNYNNVFVAGTIYDMTMSIQGSLVLDAPLAPNLDNALVVPLSFNFSDGVNTYTEITSPHTTSGTTNSSNFTFSTDSLGDITSWGIGIDIKFPSPTSVDDFWFTLNTRYFPLLGLDDESANAITCLAVSAGVCTSLTSLNLIRTLGDHGSWSSVSSASPVPVPAAVWLFGTALIGLVGFGKRRKAA